MDIGTRQQNFRDQYMSLPADLNILGARPSKTHSTVKLGIFHY